jgi:hypothetical protein
MAAVLEIDWYAFAGMMTEALTPIFEAVRQCVSSFKKAGLELEHAKIPAPKTPTIQAALHKPKPDVKQPVTQQPHLRLNQPRRDKRYFWRS